MLKKHLYSTIHFHAHFKEVLFIIKRLERFRDNILNIFVFFLILISKKKLVQLNQLLTTLDMTSCNFHSNLLQLFEMAIFYCFYLMEWLLFVYFSTSMNQCLQNHCALCWWAGKSLLGVLQIDIPNTKYQTIATTGTASVFYVCTKYYVYLIYLKSLVGVCSLRSELFFYFYQRNFRFLDMVKKDMVSTWDKNTFVFHNSLESWSESAAKC